MNRNFCSGKIIALLIFIFAITPIHGNEISSSIIELSPNSIEHISFMTYRNMTIDIRGSTDNNFTLTILNNENYQFWKNQTNYESLLEMNISSDFIFEINLIINTNTSIHFLFINRLGNITALIEYNISARDITKTNVSLQGIILGFAGLTVYKILRVRRQN